MVRRSDFLEGLKARLDGARAEPEQPEAATPPEWPVVPTAIEDDPSRPVAGEQTAADDGAPTIGEPVATDSDAPAVGEPSAADSDAPVVGGEWRERAATARQAALPPGLDDRPPPNTEGIGTAAGSEPDHPAKSWTERGMPERMRAAIASVRRISSGARPDPDRHRPERLGDWVAPDHRALQETFDQVARPVRTRQATRQELAGQAALWRIPADEPPVSRPAARRRGIGVRREPPGQAALWRGPDDESPVPVPAPRRRGIGVRREPPGQAALWRSPDDESPVPVLARRRRGIPVAALVATTIVVLVVGSSLGLLLAGWNLELPSLLSGMAASPPGPVAESEAPATAAPAPPPITEIVRVERPPVPPAAAAEDPPPTAADAAQLPPPRPAPRSSSAREGPAATDPIDQALQTLLAEARGAGGPFEPVVEDAGARPGLRVSVNYAASAAGGPATAMHLVRHLKAQGFTVEAREVDFAIASDSIRYFFDADRDAAEALSSSLAGQVPGGEAPPVVDFTHYEPKPQEGHLELWIGA
jgi:hypothetical protein